MKTYLTGGEQCTRTEGQRDPGLEGIHGPYELLDGMCLKQIMHAGTSLVS